MAERSGTGVVLVVGSGGRRLTLKEREWGASASASPSASEKQRRKGNAEPWSTRLCACASTAATSSVARRSASYLASISLRGLRRQPPLALKDLRLILRREAE